MLNAVEPFAAGNLVALVGVLAVVLSGWNLRWVPPGAAAAAAFGAALGAGVEAGEDLVEIVEEEDLETVAEASAAVVADRLAGARLAAALAETEAMEIDPAEVVVLAPTEAAGDLVAIGAPSEAGTADSAGEAEDSEEGRMAASGELHAAFTQSPFANFIFIGVVAVGVLGIMAVDSTTTRPMGMVLLQVRVDSDLPRLDMGLRREEEGVGMGPLQADSAGTSSEKDLLVGMMKGMRNGQGIEEVYLAFPSFPSDFLAKVTVYVFRSSIFGGCAYAPAI